MLVVFKTIEECTSVMYIAVSAIRYHWCDPNRQLYPLTVGAFPSRGKIKEVLVASVGQTR